MNPKQDWTEQAKKKAALEAIRNIKDGFTVGLGSGSTAAYAIEEIGKRIKNERIHVLGIPTSYQSFMLAIKHEIPVTTLEEHPTPELAIDGADQIDPELNLIKGMGGALAREKIVATACRKLVIIADESKKANFLGEDNHPVPIEVLPSAISLVTRKLDELNGRFTLREGTGKVGPVITDNGNVILDTVFGRTDRPAELECTLKKITGVVETGLFINLAEMAYVGNRSGVEKLLRKS